MIDDTSSSTPESISPTIEYEHPDFGDGLEVAEEYFKHFKSSAEWVFRLVTEEFFKDGPLHGITAYDLASGYSVCVSDILDAARYLEGRGLLTIDGDTPSEDDCHCDACQAKRSYLSLPYSYAADREIVNAQRQREVGQAQRQAQHIINQQRRDQGYVYLIKCGPRFKIGITKDMNRRMDQLRGQSPYPLEVVHSAKGHHNAGKESTLHKRYGTDRKHGEWFELSPDQVSEIIEDLNEWSRESDE